MKSDLLICEIHAILRQQNGCRCAEDQQHGHKNARQHQGKFSRTPERRACIFTHSNSSFSFRMPCPELTGQNIPEGVPNCEWFLSNWSFWLFILHQRRCKAEGFPLTLQMGCAYSPCRLQFSILCDMIDISYYCWSRVTSGRQQGKSIQVMPGQ